MKKGTRVIVSGEGRTAKWGRIEGTVERATKRAVFVRWDGTSFSDEMKPSEIKEVTK
jgi:single-stranded DNA-binding protein